MSALSDALVKVARVFNLVGKVYEDDKLSWKDALTVWSGLGDLGALSSIDFSGVASEVGKLSDKAKDEAIAKFVKTFDLPSDASEATYELAVDAAFDILLGLAKGRRVFSHLCPKAA